MNMKTSPPIVGSVPEVQKLNRKEYKMDQELRKIENPDEPNKSSLMTSDLASSAQKRPELAAQNSQLSNAPARDNRSAQYATATAPAREEVTPLFAFDELQSLRTRWDAIQVGFVDEPRRSVEEADHLVAEAMKRLAEIFSNERQTLELEWDRGGNVSTEDLRIALRRYRSFFGRLLSI